MPSVRIPTYGHLPLNVIVTSDQCLDYSDTVCLLLNHAVAVLREIFSYPLPIPITLAFTGRSMAVVRAHCGYVI